MAEQGTGGRQFEPASQSVAREPLRVGANIADRLCALGTRVLLIARRLPRDPLSKHVALQLVRAATSAGANYEEARAAESRSDFIHKVKVAAKEVREASYWLRLVHGAHSASRPEAEHVDALFHEACELCAILMASARTAKGSGP